MTTTNEVTGLDPDATYECPGAVEMAAFDALPPVARDALNYAPGPLSARSFADQVDEGMPVMLVLSMAQDACREHYGRAHDGWGTMRHKPCRR